MKTNNFHNVEDNSCLKVHNTQINKKTCQSKANCPLTNSPQVVPKWVNKFEQIWELPYKQTDRQTDAHTTEDITFLTLQEVQ